MMKLLFLGTSATTPTKERNHTGFLFRFENENILIDCGENIQRQLRIAGIAATKITKIFITHLHGDHVFGLPGIIQNLKLHQYSSNLEIYGPVGLKKMMEGIFRVFDMKGHAFKINVHEISKSGIFIDGKKLVVEASFMKHGTKCLAYSIREKDRRKINMEYVKKLGLEESPLLGNLQRGKSV